jgi:hypothetical protein
MTEKAELLLQPDKVLFTGKHLYIDLKEDPEEIIQNY